MADLLIRAALNDHHVVNDLLAPGASPRFSRRPLIGQLVADASVAEARPVLADLARGAGIPYLVDPDTPLLQSEVAGTNSWTQLSYAVRQALSPEDIDADRLAEQVVEFQLDKGAMMIIPPYFYASSPSDPWFLLNLALLDRTADYLDRREIRLPLQPVFCAQLQSFGTEPTWSAGVDRFVNRVKGVGAQAIALYFSPTGAPGDSYGKVMRLFDTAIHIKEQGLRTVAWRQGVFGPSLVAAGLDGYECGMGAGEQTDVVGRQSSRKPRPNATSGGGGSRIFIETLGRSVSRKVGQVLLGDIAMRPKVMCDDEGCCSSVAETIDRSRHHAVRTRVKGLDELMDQPHRLWRLNYVSRQAESAATLADQVNKVLVREGIKEKINPRHLQALAQVTRHLADSDWGHRSATG